MILKGEQILIILTINCLDDDPKGGPYSDYLDYVMFEI